MASRFVFLFCVYFFFSINTFKQTKHLLWQLLPSKHGKMLWLTWIYLETCKRCSGSPLRFRMCWVLSTFGLGGSSCHWMHRSQLNRLLIIKGMAQVLEQRLRHWTCQLHTHTHTDTHRHTHTPQAHHKSLSTHTHTKPIIKVYQCTHTPQTHHKSISTHTYTPHTKALTTSG